MNNLKVDYCCNVNFGYRTPNPDKVKRGAKQSKILTFDDGRKDFKKMTPVNWIRKHQKNPSLVDLLCSKYENAQGFMVARFEEIPSSEVITALKDNFKGLKKIFNRNNIVEEMYRHEGEYMAGKKSILEELSDKSPKALDQALFSPNLRSGKIPLHIFMENNKIEFVESLNKAYKEHGRLDKLADMYLVKDSEHNVDYPLALLPEITVYQKQKVIQELNDTFKDRPDLLEKVLGTMK